VRSRACHLHLVSIFSFQVFRESLEAAIVVAVLLSLVEAIVSNNPNTGSPTDSTTGADEKEKDPENLEPIENKVEEVNMDQAAFVKKLRLQVRSGFLDLVSGYY
jgi:high-affinity iron transporter